MLARKIFYYIYYGIKPFLPRRLQVVSRQLVARIKRKQCQAFWPINESANILPNNWKGWPERKKFALLLTHDVETDIGQGKCQRLANIEMRYNLRSSFNFIPERYKVFSEIRNWLVNHGFEVCVHGLNHDGKLYFSKEIFMQRKNRINHYLNQWEVVGFHSPSSHRNMEFLHHLNIEYDQSTFDTDPFEPSPQGVKTIFPFWIDNGIAQDGFVEFPYTVPQDFTVFILLKEQSIHIWKEKLDWLVEQGGLVLLKTHPDYMSFKKEEDTFETYPVNFYTDFLTYITERYRGQYWHVLPKHLASFWKELSFQEVSRTDYVNKSIA